MSDQSNIDIVRRLTQEGFVDGNVGLIDELVAQDCEDHDPLPGQPQGRDGQRQTCRMVVEGLSDRSTAHHDLIAAGDTVIESWTFRGMHTGAFMGVPATGKPVAVRGIEIWRVADGKIVERWGVVDSGAVMAQLGVLP